MLRLLPLLRLFVTWCENDGCSGGHEVAVIWPVSPSMAVLVCLMFDAFICYSSFLAPLSLGCSPVAPVLASLFLLCSLNGAVHAALDINLDPTGVEGSMHIS